MRSSGFVPPSVEAIPVYFGLLWIAGVFLLELVRVIRGVTIQPVIAMIEAPIRALAWSGICVIIVVVSWIFAAIVFPDSSVIYFKLNRSYITSNWQIDPVTKLPYFPTAFYKADLIGRSIVPSHYYVLDEQYRITFEPFFRRFEIRECRDEYTIVVSVEDRTYFVRQYTEEGGSYIKPCLITPTLKNDRPP